MIDIVLRCRNDARILERTLAALRRQTLPCRIVAFDNESTDGSREILDRIADRVVTVPAGRYVPGRVLNAAMRETEGDIVAFVNSDCVAQHDTFLERLLAGLSDDRVGAVFGRQTPRPDCHPLHARDTEETYGDGVRQKRWRHCFSMAASAVRRAAWAEAAFSESLRYSEDIDWTWRARQRGWIVRYVSDAVVEHSHNYSWQQFYQRHFGEGEAEAYIFEWSPWERSLLRYSILPYARQVLHDLRWCLQQKRPGAAFASPALRLAQLLGRRAGLLTGLSEISNRRFAQPAEPSGTHSWPVPPPSQGMGGSTECAP
ncbi:MAG: glycosyltransferase family 2 protein [Candidatus Xenobia bacterium]